MFRALQRKIIVITMTITTAILIVAGISIMIFSSAIRPEPKLPPNPTFFSDLNSGQELKNFIENDREEGNIRLLITLLLVGVMVEIIVFIISYYSSGKIVEPVENAYDKQKIFIANASHELKTPLAVIGASVEALEVNEENETWKNNIETEITRANKLVLDLLQLAQMDAGKVDKCLSERFDLSAIIEERIKVFKSKFSGKFIFKKETNDTIFTLPKQDFLQLLDILLDNATKYGDKDISVILKQQELIVMNDGATIEKENLKKIFDRFYQTDKTKAGSGLGLAIADAICKRNNWQIICESGKNCTKFIVRF